MARIISGFAGNSTKNLKFSVKKTSASFRKDAGVAKELQFIIFRIMNIEIAKPSMSSLSLIQRIDDN